MSKNKLFYILSRYIIFVTVIICSNAIFAEGWTHTLSLNKQTGTALYQIGGFATNQSGNSVFQFPVSELTFPINATYLQESLHIPLTQKWSLTAKGSLALSQSVGMMKDSDWLRANYSMPDVYSESKTNFHAIVIACVMSFLLIEGSRTVLILLSGVGELSSLFMASRVVVQRGVGMKKSLLVAIILSPSIFGVTANQNGGHIVTTTVLANLPTTLLPY